MFEMFTFASDSSLPSSESWNTLNPVSPDDVIRRAPEWFDATPSPAETSPTISKDHTSLWWETRVWKQCCVCKSHNFSKPSFELPGREPHPLPHRFMHKPHPFQRQYLVTRTSGVARKRHSVIGPLWPFNLKKMCTLISAFQTSQLFNTWTVQPLKWRPTILHVCPLSLKLIVCGWSWTASKWLQICVHCIQQITKKCKNLMWLW